jgi:NodT family efflux transporter outer membrane factor (OMF) lipoprotein
MPTESRATPSLRWAHRTLGAVLLASLGACANYSGILPQARPLDAKALGLQDGPAAPRAAAASATPALDAQWWRMYSDAQLDQLITQALDKNPSLRVAQARLQRMQAGSDAIHAADIPQLGAGADLTRQRFSANSIYPAPLGGSIQELGTVQANASWELDFFGKNRAALEAALGQTRAAQADAQAARMLLASNITRTYFQLVRLNAQLDVAQRTLAQREQTRQLVQDRVNAGLDTQLELQQSNSALPDARLQIELIQEQKALALNALAALTAQPISALALEIPAQTAIKTVAIAQTIPMDLLGRRADIAAARWRVEAAARDVDSAKAQFYPNVNLTAFAGYSSIGFDRLQKTGSDQWGVGPAIRLPLFDAGRLRANLRGKTADLDAAVESYNALVLDAVRDVADQLTSAQAIGRQQAEHAAAQTSAEAAYAIALQRYQAGLGNYLQVLSAETAVLAQRRQGVDLAARAIDTQVQLIRALGGGYTEEPATAAVAAAPATAQR